MDERGKYATELRWAGAADRNPPRSGFVQGKAMLQLSALLPSSAAKNPQESDAGRALDVLSPAHRKFGWFDFTGKFHPGEIPLPEIRRGPDL